MMKDLEQQKIKDFSKEYWSHPTNSLVKENRERVDTILKSIPPDAESALEIGCGTGEIINSVELESRMGLDIDADILNNVNCQTTVATASEIPFKDKSWDIVIVSEVLEHILPADYEKALHEINRVAGRYILASVPNHEVLSSNYTRCNNCGAVYNRNLHFRAYSKHSMSSLFKNFDLQYAKEIGGFIRSRTRIENLVRHRIMNNWAPLRNTICPECGTSYFDDKPQNVGTQKNPEDKGRIRRIAADITGRRRAIWLLASYKRSDGM